MIPDLKPEGSKFFSNEEIEEMMVVEAWLAVVRRTNEILEKDSERTASLITEPRKAW